MANFKIMISVEIPRSTFYQTRGNPKFRDRKKASDVSDAFVLYISTDSPGFAMITFALSCFPPVFETLWGLLV
jgi:hypothetical protein